MALEKEGKRQEVFHSLVQRENDLYAVREHHGWWRCSMLFRKLKRLKDFLHMWILFLFCALWLSFDSADQILPCYRANVQAEWKGLKDQQCQWCFLGDEHYPKPPFVILQIFHLNPCCSFPWKREPGELLLTVGFGYDLVELRKSKYRGMFWKNKKWLFDIYRIISIQEEETFFW